MAISDLKILLIEDNVEDAESFQEILNKCPGHFNLERSDRLSAGLRLIEKESFDLVFLDLELPDSGGGIKALPMIQRTLSKLPIIILTGLSDERIALKAISLGAQDYLIKGTFNSDLLYRSILYAVERNRAYNLSQALNKINILIHSTLDFDVILDRIVVEAASAIGSESAAISLPVADRWIVKCIFGLPKEIIGMQMSENDEPHTVLAIRTKKPIAIDDAFNDKRTNHDYMQKWNIRSIMVVPLIMENQVIGVIFFNYHKRVFNFSEIHIDFANKLAASLSMAIQNAQLFENFQTELAQRQRAEEALTRGRDESELRVLKRTAELSVTNEELLAEIEERKRIEGTLNKSLQQVHQHAAHLQSIREEERTNIAREIHDQLGQALTALKIDLSLMMLKLSKNSESKTLGEQLKADVDLIDSAIVSVKKICTRLRPAILDHLGLEAAVQWQVEEFQKRTDCRCVLTEDLKNIVLENHVATAIFRILQEALTNVMRHAEATMVKVTLSKQDGSIVLEVQDNGKGYKESSSTTLKSFGLVGIKERVRSLGGSFRISATKVRGTTITVSIPIDASLPSSIQ